MLHINFVQSYVQVYDAVSEIPILPSVTLCEVWMLKI
jgi:hypothetical protein